MVCFFRFRFAQFYWNGFVKFSRKYLYSVESKTVCAVWRKKKMIAKREMPYYVKNHTLVQKRASRSQNVQKYDGYLLPHNICLSGSRLSICLFIHFVMQFFFLHFVCFCSFFLSLFRKLVIVFAVIYLLSFWRIDCLFVLVVFCLFKSFARVRN